MCPHTTLYVCPRTTINKIQACQDLESERSGLQMSNKMLEAELEEKVSSSLRPHAPVA